MMPAGKLIRKISMVHSNIRVLYTHIRNDYIYTICMSCHFDYCHVPPLDAQASPQLISDPLCTCLHSSEPFFHTIANSDYLLTLDSSLERLHNQFISRDFCLFVLFLSYTIRPTRSNQTTNVLEYDITITLCILSRPIPFIGLRLSTLA